MPKMRQRIMLNNMLNMLNLNNVIDNVCDGVPCN